MIACQLGEDFLEGAYPCQTDETFPLAGGGRGVTSTAATPTSSQGRPGLGARGPPLPARLAWSASVSKVTGRLVTASLAARERQRQGGSARWPRTPATESSRAVSASHRPLRPPRHGPGRGLPVSGSAVASLPSCLPAPLDIRLTVPGKRGGGRPAVPTSRYQGAPSRLCCREPKLSRTVSGAVLGRPHLCRPRKGRSHQDHVP